MNPKFGKPQRPREQWSILSPKGKPPQAKWIIGVFADEEFSLLPFNLTWTEAREWTEPRPYSQLWTTLAAMELDAAKVWLIGHRVRYALERADFLQALEDEAVALPRSKKKGEKHKRSGRLSHSVNCLEIDLVAGRNQIKILDWKNYGCDPRPDLKQVNFQTQSDAEDDFRRYLKMCECTGLLLTKTTSAQMGWQHARMNHAPAVLMYNLDPEARSMERRAYYGGRNEAYTLGDIPDAVFSLDVKSSYASICRDFPLPVYMDAEYPLGLPVEEIDNVTDKQWIADVIISTPTPDYPVRHGGVIIYPTGTFYTSLAWPELFHALRRGRIDKVLRAACYTADFAFRDYANWYLDAREKVTKAGLTQIASALKATFNGSLGYTARERYTLQPWDTDIGLQWWIGYTSAPDRSTPIVHTQILDGVKEWLKIGGEPREAMPFLHATICSWARIRLLQIMESAGRDYVHYCDTDGILVDYRGWAALADTPGMIGTQPGQLGERFKSGPCRIQGQKNYSIGGNVICAGMIRTRDSVWQQKKVLETPTGRVDSEGRVHPFEMRCEDVGGEQPKYVNVMA